MDKTPKVPLHKVAEQLANNSTGWIGKIPGHNDHLIKGQTFVANEDGDLLSIQVFPNMVVNKSHVGITLHSFDPEDQSWGQVMGSSIIELERTDAGKWISFNITGARLEKGQSYGFRLDSSDSYMGIGEACGSFKQPAFKTGKEWQFTKNNPKGDSFPISVLRLRLKLQHKKSH